MATSPPCYNARRLPLEPVTILHGILLPAAVAVVALLLFDWRNRRAMRRTTSVEENDPKNEGVPILDYTRPARRTWANGLIGVAFAVAFCYAMRAVAMPQYPHAPPLWPVRIDWHWSFYVAAGAGAVSAAVGRLGTRTQLIVWSLTAVAALAVLSWPRMSRPAFGSQPAWSVPLVLSMAALPMLLATPALVFVQHRRGALAGACALAVTAALGTLAVGFLGKSATLANAAIAPAALCAAVALVLAFRPAMRLPVSAWATLALLTQASTLIAIEPWSGDMPLLDGMLLLLAPVASLAALWGAAERRWATACVAIVATLACCGVPIAHILDTAMQYRDDGYL